MRLLLNGNLDHLHGNLGVVIPGGGGIDGGDHILAADNTTKDGVLGRGGLVKKVKETVVNHIDEELTAAGVGLARVGHGQGEGFVGQTRARSRAELVLDAALAVSGLGANARNLITVCNSQNIEIIKKFMYISYAV